MAAFPRIYTSFAEFERDELRRLDSLRTTVEDMLDERFSEELEEASGGGGKSAGNAALRRRLQRRSYALD
ncbi:hypothetical protein [Haliangium ochraceum]|uniref:Uncharacterized protein n=1 Tax=Haliangium ochraceum (strain DSM 14365 / JCM 11303 / SMP-2) TaxID=502025 RepID=D0LQ46_HALO1|nr:hypothetical protein [Haliangium ochraceum]ACY17083.1 hypothetical protein Hoch_4592 [Haliangium ochraceum DSM 14365]